MRSGKLDWQRETNRRNALRARLPSALHAPPRRLRRRPAPSAGHPYGVPPASPAPPPVKWLAFGQAALPGRGLGRAVQLDRLRRAGRYAPRQEPAAQTERPQWAFRKKRGRQAGVPQNGHQSAREGRRSVFQGKGNPTLPSSQKSPTALPSAFVDTPPR